MSCELLFCVVLVLPNIAVVLGSVIGRGLPRALLRGPVPH